MVVVTTKRKRKIKRMRKLWRNERITLLKNRKNIMKRRKKKRNSRNGLRRKKRIFTALQLFLLRIPREGEWRNEIVLKVLFVFYAQRCLGCSNPKSDNGLPWYDFQKPLDVNWEKYIGESIDPPPKSKTSAKQAATQFFLAPRRPQHQPNSRERTE